MEATLVTPTPVRNLRKSRHLFILARWRGSGIKQRTGHELVMLAPSIPCGSHVAAGGLRAEFSPCLPRKLVAPTHLDRRRRAGGVAGHLECGRAVGRRRADARCVLRGGSGGGSDRSAMQHVARVFAEREVAQTLCRVAGRNARVASPGPTRRSHGVNTPHRRAPRALASCAVRRSSPNASRPLAFDLPSPTHAARSASCCRRRARRWRHRRPLPERVRPPRRRGPRRARQ